MGTQDTIRSANLNSLASRVVNTVTGALGMDNYIQPDPTFVLGIDTSHWTGVVDWEAAKANGIRFVIIKMLDGKDHVRFSEQNYKGAPWTQACWWAVINGFTRPAKSAQADRRGNLSHT